MSARASIYFDCNQLRDVLLLEDVSGSLAYGDAKEAFSKIGKVRISLDDDRLVDDIVKALTRLQRDAAKRRLERDVARLTRELGNAQQTKIQRNAEWKRADEEERAIHSKLHLVQKNLDALLAQEGS